MLVWTAEKACDACLQVTAPAAGRVNSILSASGNAQLVAKKRVRCKLPVFSRRPLTILNPTPEQAALRYPFHLGVFMSDCTTTALLRKILGEVCEHVGPYETGARTRVASNILEAAMTGGLADRLKPGGRVALSEAPTMWR